MATQPSDGAGRRRVSKEERRVAAQEGRGNEVIGDSLRPGSPAAALPAAGTPAAGLPSVNSPTPSSPMGGTSHDPSPFSRAGSEDAGTASEESLTREQRIALAAYRRAEQRGFAPGGEMEDWLSAEREIDGAAGNGGTRSQSPGGLSPS